MATKKKAPSTIRTKKRGKERAPGSNVTSPSMLTVVYSSSPIDVHRPGGATETHQSETGLYAEVVDGALTISNHVGYALIIYGPGQWSTVGTQPV